MVNRVTGLQAAQLGLLRLLEAWRGQFGPREYATLLDLLARWLDRECQRTGASGSKKAA